MHSQCPSLPRHSGGIAIAAIARLRKQRRFGASRERRIPSRIRMRRSGCCRRIADIRVVRLRAVSYGMGRACGPPSDMDVQEASILSIWARMRMVSCPVFGKRAVALLMRAKPCLQQQEPIDKPGGLGLVEANHAVRDKFFSKSFEMRSRSRS